MPHDWFADLTGFREEGYEETRSRLRVEGDELVSTVNGNRYGAFDSGYAPRPGEPGGDQWLSSSTRWPSSRHGLRPPLRDNCG